MNYATSRHLRRLLGRLTRGENLVASIEHICRREKVRAGTVRAIGVLQKVEIQSYEAGKGYQTTLQAEGTFELLTLTGTISTLGDQVILNSYAQVATQQLGGQQVLGGRLFEASAISVEFVIEASDDVILERRLETRLGLPILNRIETLAGESMVERVDEGSASAPEPPAEVAPTVPEPVAEKPAPAPKAAPAPKPAPKKKATPPAPAPSAVSSDGTVATPSTPTVVRRPSWGDAVQYSKGKTTEKKLGVSPKAKQDKSSANLDIVVEWKEQPNIKSGDLLEHSHFGLCSVIKVEEDNFLRVRKPNRKVVDIKLEVCDIQPAGKKDGKNLFLCKIVRR
jgi:uncharacterized protein